MPTPYLHPKARNAQIALNSKKRAKSDNGSEVELELKQIPKVNVTHCCHTLAQ